MSFNLKSVLLKKILILLVIIRVSFINLSCSSDTSANASVAMHDQIIENIDVSQSFVYIQHNKSNENFVLLDIRTQNEFLNGHIENAINLDFYNPDFRSYLNKLDKSKTYLIYCRTANRTGHALLMMKQLGFAEVYNMEGGIVQWRRNGFEIVRPSKIQ